MSFLKKRGDEQIDANAHTEESPETTIKRRKQSENAVFRYIVVLFIFVLLIILLSYFIQLRNSNSTITKLTEQHSEFSVQALENIDELQNKNMELASAVDEANEKIESLEREIEELEAENDEADEALSQAETEIFRLKNSRTAIEKLWELDNAVKSGDEVAVSEAMERISPYTPYLDGAYSELYESIKNNLN